MKIQYNGRKRVRCILCNSFYGCLLFDVTLIWIIVKKKLKKKLKTSGLSDRVDWRYFVFLCQYAVSTYYAGIRVPTYKFAYASKYYDKYNYIAVQIHIVLYFQSNDRYKENQRMKKGRMSWTLQGRNVGHKARNTVFVMSYLLLGSNS